MIILALCIKIQVDNLFENRETIKTVERVESGKIDLVAHGLTVTNDRKEQVSFTDYLYLTHQVLVQRKPENWRRMSWSAVQKELVHDAIELIGDTVSIRENSAYFKRLQHLSEEIGGQIYIDTLPGHISTDRIIKMVVDGDIKYTIADNVEDMILELSYPSNYNRPEIKYGYVRGIEPYTYVKQIFERYEHYVQFIKMEDEG